MVEPITKYSDAESPAHRMPHWWSLNFFSTDKKESEGTQGTSCTDVGSDGGTKTAGGVFLRECMAMFTTAVRAVAVGVVWWCWLLQYDILQTENCLSFCRHLQLTPCTAFNLLESNRRDRSQSSFYVLHICVGYWFGWWCIGSAAATELPHLIWRAKERQSTAFMWYSAYLCWVQIRMVVYGHKAASKTNVLASVFLVYLFPGLCTHSEVCRILA